MKRASEPIVGTPGFSRDLKLWALILAPADGNAGYKRLAQVKVAQEPVSSIKVSQLGCKGHVLAVSMCVCVCTCAYVYMHLPVQG